jgi:hypothetical protein
MSNIHRAAGRALTGRWRLTGVIAWALAATLAVASAPAAAQSGSLAPGFATLARADDILVLPVDVELYSLSAGGVPEPKADWTQTAAGHMKQALQARIDELGLRSRHADEAHAEEFAEQVSLHAAVAQSIALHHAMGGVMALPTKQSKLDWSFGDAMQGLQARSGARYGLFVWVRDSYASAERKAAMVAMALLGIGLTGGFQVGYASLVDLQTGQVLWFNRLARASGDLREAEPAAESMKALLAGFPTAAQP